MKVDEYGLVGFAERELVDILRCRPHFKIDNLYVERGDKYITACAETFLDMPSILNWDDHTIDLSPAEFHAALQNEWLMPEEYQKFDIAAHLLSLCDTLEQTTRINMELKLYTEFNLLPLLRYLKYLRECADSNNIVWGVGRGSSCCSYCLYLLRIHRVDSLYYNLDITEFLKH